MEREGGGSSSGKDIIDLFLGDVRGIPLLTPQEERELGRQIQAGRAAYMKLKIAEAEGYPRDPELEELVKQGEEAKSKLVKSNTKLVIYIAKRHIGHGVPFEDLIQEGVLGLMRAAEKFDPERGTKFSTYATWWIRHGGWRAIESRQGSMGPAVETQRLLMRKRKMEIAYFQIYGVFPSDEEMCEMLGVSPQRLEALKKADKLSMYSLEEVVTNTPNSQDMFDEGRMRIEYIRGDCEVEEEILERVRQDELRELVRQVIHSIDLTERERFILKEYFGLDGKEDRENVSLRILGEDLSLSRERVRQLRNSAMEKLKKYLEENPEIKEELLELF